MVPAAITKSRFALLFTMTTFGILTYVYKETLLYPTLIAYNHNLTYHPPTRPELSGKSFRDVDQPFLYNLMPESRNLTRDNLGDYVFVTAASNNFFERLTSLVRSIQDIPSSLLIIYDIGLTQNQLRKMKHWCKVEIRKFDFAKYPYHVSNLLSYAFKPIIITEVFRETEFMGVFWVDSSAQIKKKNLTDLLEIALKSGGVTAFEGTNHSVYAVTPKNMFEFLPFVGNSKHSECLMATLILFYRTSYVLDHIIFWWLACALSHDCIWSYTNRHCSFGKDRWERFAQCSRFDQSALSILLYDTYSNIINILGPRVFKSENKLLKVHNLKGVSSVQICDIS